MEDDCWSEFETESTTSLIYPGVHNLVYIVGKSAGKDYSNSSLR